MSSNGAGHLEMYSGQRDCMGNPHGRGTILLNSENDRFEGHFRHGLKEGRGCFFFADGSSLSGSFHDDVLEGQGVYTYEDGHRMVGQYRDGDLNGYCEEFDTEERLIFSGHYRDNVRYGVCCSYDEFGGKLFGIVDRDGSFSGKNIVYSYPGEDTHLKGKFHNGQMVNAQLADYVGYGDRGNPYSYVKKKQGPQYRLDVSSSSRISSEPFLGDPYEAKRVYVKVSDIECAGEGLFARRAAPADEVMSFYNGIRVSHSEVDGRDWSFNDNTISLDDTTVIDVPLHLSATSNYCASLGHKANHSFTPNCKYDRFDHPRFGRIKCIRTIKSVRQDEELTVAYGYDHTKLETEAPDWYRNILRAFQSCSQTS